MSDYKHHWSDVLAGLLQGGLVAILTVGSTYDGNRGVCGKKQSRLCSNFSHFVLLQVVCATSFFEQPVDPVVSQEEGASHSSLQDNPLHENHYGSTD